MIFLFSVVYVFQQLQGSLILMLRKGEPDSEENLALSQQLTQGCSGVLCLWFCFGPFSGTANYFSIFRTAIILVIVFNLLGDFLVWFFSGYVNILVKICEYDEFSTQPLNTTVAEIVNTSHRFWNKEKLGKVYLPFLHFVLLTTMQSFHLMSQILSTLYYTFLFSIVMSMLQWACDVVLTASLDID